MNPSELVIVAKATVRVLRDSNRIKDIHLVSDITSRGRFSALLATARRHGDDAEIMRRRPEINDAEVDFDALARLPEDTLGGAYARHLRCHELEVYTDATSERFIDDPEVRYLVHRYRQTHDVWHVLLGLGTRGHEEVLVHAFTLGQLGLPVSALIVFFGTLKHIVLERRWATLRRGLMWEYRRGRAAQPLLLVEWEALWDRPLPEVRTQFGIAVAPQ